MTRRLLAGLGGLLLLASGLVGLPVFLLASHQALAAQLPTLAQVPAALLAPGEGGLFLLLLFAVGWVCWVVFTIAFVAEVVARVRGGRAPQLGAFFPQQTTARAVSAVVLLLALAPTSGAASAAASSPSSHAATPAAQAGIAAPATAVRATAAAAPDVAPAPADAIEANPGAGERDHTVVRGDTLWDIADDELGDPTRYPEIFEANDGDLQPDGERLVDPDLIIPGWVLEIPGSAPTPVAAAPDGGSEVPESDSADDPSLGAVPPDASPPAVADGSAGSADGPSTSPVPGLDRVADGGSGADAGSAGSTDGPTTSPVPGLDRTSGDAAAPDGEPSEASVGPSAGPSALSPGAVPPIERAAALRPETAILLPAGGTLAALLLAGVAGELARRRRQFQRHRRPGERMPQPGAGALEVERAARGATHEAGLDLLERALAHLAQEASTAGAPLPDVRLVRVTQASVSLDLATPSGADDPPVPAIPPFVATGERLWQLDAALLAGDPVTHARAYPGLVVLGFRGPETVLIDLESVGTLAVEGPDSTVADVVRGLAVELAFGPARAATGRTLCLLDTAIADAVEAGDLSVESATGKVAAMLAHRMRQRRPGEHGHKHLGADAEGGEPVEIDPLEIDPLEIVLADVPLPMQVPGRSGAALITTAPASGAGARLVVDGSGGATLLPDRLALVPQSISARASSDLIAALRGTDLPDDETTSIGATSRDPASGADVMPGPGKSGEAAGPLESMPATRAGASMLGTAGREPAHLEAGEGASSAVGPDAPVEVTIDLRDRPDEPRRDLPLLTRGLGGPVGPISGPDRSRSAAEAATFAAPARPATLGTPGIPRVLVLGEVLVENAHGRGCCGIGGV